MNVLNRAGSGTWLVQRHHDAVAQAAAGREGSRIFGFGEPNSLMATSGWLQGPERMPAAWLAGPESSIRQQKRPGKPGRSNQQPCGCWITWRWKPGPRTRTSWPEPRSPGLRQQPERRPGRSWPGWSGRQTPGSRTRPRRWRRGSAYALQWSPGIERATMARRCAYSARSAVWTLNANGYFLILHLAIQREEGLTAVPRFAILTGCVFHLAWNRDTWPPPPATTPPTLKCFRVLNRSAAAPACTPTPRGPTTSSRKSWTTRWTRRWQGTRSRSMSPCTRTARSR